MRDGPVLPGADAAAPHGAAVAGVRGRLARAAVAIAAGVLLAMTVDAGAPMLATMILLLAATTALLLTRGTASMPGRRHASPEQAASGTFGASGEQAAAVAHDLRSPLVTVHSYLELLAGGAFGPLPPEARRAAERATRAAARAQALVERTLREHAIETATAPIEHSDAERAATVNLVALLTDVTASLEAEIAGSGAQVTIGRLPAVRGDGTALYRVFTNLLQNAVTHGAPAGGAAPHIHVAGRESDGMCEIEVRDRGPGIASADIERIFGAGARGDAEPVAPGSGLGLATVRRLVVEQGGRVWIDDTVSEGTCVRLSLPAA